MNFKQGAFSARNIATLGVLTALVFVLQIGSTLLMRFGLTSISLVLVPIVMGAMLIGPWAGAFLGFVFSSVVFFSALFGLDPFTQPMIQTNWFLTFLIIYCKGVSAGFVSGLIFKWLKEKNQRVAVGLSSISAPIVNTGIFIIGTLLTSSVFFASFHESVEVVILTVCSVNFVIEFIINVVAAPALYTVVKVIEKKKQR